MRQPSTTAYIELESWQNSGQAAADVRIVNTPGEGRFVIGIDGQEDVNLRADVARHHPIVTVERGDNDLEFAEETGIGDSAQWVSRVSDTRGTYVVRKGNRILSIMAGGSGFQVTQALKSNLRQAVVRALDKL